jgi:hypothetical protein
MCLHTQTSSSAESLQVLGYLTEERAMMERTGGPVKQPILLLPGPENAAAAATGSLHVNGKHIAVDQENGEVCFQMHCEQMC